MNVYSAVVTGNTLATSRNKGTPSVEIQVRTTANLTTGESVAKTLTGNLWLSGKAIDSTTETLYKVFGWCGESFAELGNPILSGIQVDVVTEDEVYEGKSYEKLKFFNRPGESAAKPLTPADPAEARAIASQADAALRSFKASKASATAQGQKAYTGPTPGSGLPF